MNRAFKRDFHNGEPDEKVIVSMSVAVKNGKRFHGLDNKGKQALVEELLVFKKRLDSFTSEVIMSMDKPKD